MTLSREPHTCEFCDRAYKDGYDTGRLHAKNKANENLARRLTLVEDALLRYFGGERAAPDVSRDEAEARIGAAGMRAAERRGVK